MPDIPVVTPLGWLGVFFLIVGFFLVIAGLDILKIEKVTVPVGRKTWTTGLIVALIGFLFLLPDIKDAITGTSTPTPIVTSTVSPPDNSGAVTTVAPPVSTASETSVVVTHPATATIQSPTPTDALTINSTSTPVPVILFESNFENGASDWDADDDYWKIRIGDDGNHFYCVNPVGKYSYSYAPSADWMNYRVEMRILFVKPADKGVYVTIRVDRQEPKYRYQYELTENNVNIGKPKLTDSGYQNLDYAKQSIEIGKWYSLQIVVQRSDLIYGLDGQTILQINDADANIQRGTIRLGAASDWDVCFDDIRIIELEPTE